MSGPSATEKPMSAKIAVISSMTWLIGWMRPCSAGLREPASVTSTVIGGEARKRARLRARLRQPRPRSGRVRSLL
jgi:hypothetical protein